MKKKVSANISKGPLKKIKSVSESASEPVTAQTIDNTSDNGKKSKEQIDLVALLRSLYHAILRVTEDQDNRHLWQNSKRKGLYRILNFDDLDFIDTVVKEMGWRL